jgi:hypothetical protein
MAQHNAHVNTRIDHILNQIMEALGITWPLGADFSDWYACGDELI